MLRDAPSKQSNLRYDPKAFSSYPFLEAVPAFLREDDSPSEYLERCIANIEAREPAIKAFVSLNLDGARTAADAASKRYRAGKPLSPIDGMPIAVKDVIDTEDMPTQHGSSLYGGHQPKWDAACVYWLRKAGAVIVGKTVTAEFATRPPGPTRNPWDNNRTPGGSSSGSAAAVAAGMVSVALGTQVRGSVLRPAAYCGLYAIKPTYGVIGLNGIHPLSRGLNHIGTLGTSLPDAWMTLHVLSRLCGSEANHVPLPGDPSIPEPVRPTRIIMIETPGWAKSRSEGKALLKGCFQTLAAEGVDVVDRGQDKAVEKVEQLLALTEETIAPLTAWEGRHPMLAYGDRNAAALTEFARAGLREKAAMNPDQYVAALERAREMREAYAALSKKGDVCVTLTQTAPAPEGFETGDSSFCDPFSLLHVPAITLPVFILDGLPFGMQVAGFAHSDARLIAHGRWLAQRLLRP